MSLPRTPGAYAGQISPQTIILRGPLPLNEEQRRWARFLRFDVGLDWPDIAAAIGRSEQDVRHALANARTRRGAPRRGTLNVSLAAIERFRSLQLPNEAMWQTVNRVMGV